MTDERPLTLDDLKDQIRPVGAVAGLNAITNELSADEREATRTALSHVPALRHHLKRVVNELYLFDRVMTQTQQPHLTEIDRDRLAEVRLCVERHRKALEGALEEVIGLQTLLKLSIDERYPLFGEDDDTDAADSAAP